MTITKKKQTHRYRELVVTSGEGEGEEIDRGRGLRGSNYMNKINKPQGYIVRHREYSQYFIITINGI